MPGLLADLDAIAGSTNLDSQVSGMSGAVGGIQSSLTALMQGPAPLHDLTATISAPPLPAGLSSLGNIGASLTGVLSAGPTDVLGLLAPMLGPLQGLVSGGLHVGIRVDFTASLDLFRAIMDLVGGKLWGGAQGMPLPAFLWGRQAEDAADAPTLDEIRARLAEVEATLAGFGPRLDAAGLLVLLGQASEGWARPSARWPSLPVITDGMEALYTVQTWQGMDGSALTSSLHASLDQLAALIETPRSRVALPVLEAAAAVSSGGETLGTARAALDELLTAARDRALGSGGPLSASELGRLETQVLALETLGNALDTSASPLVDLDVLAPTLERQLLRVIRTIQPPFEQAALAARARALVAQLPPPVDPVAPLTEKLQSLDLSAILGPIGEIRDAVQGAADAVRGAGDTVRQALEGPMNAVRDALHAALDAIHLPDLLAALQVLPDTLGTFINQDVKPKVESVRQAVTGAIDTVSSTVDAFNPQALLDPIRAALQSVADRLNLPEVASVFQQLNDTIGAAITAIEGLDLAPAADQSISVMDKIGQTLSKINPALIPDAVKPTLRQAVSVITDIDFTGEVATPIVNAAETALREGPGKLLGVLEDAMAEVQTRVEGFKPSNLIGDALDKPFEDLLSTLRGFHPSDLLNQLGEALKRIVAGIDVLDIEGLLQPIESAFADLRVLVNRLQPSALLKPVEEAIQAAIEAVMAATHIDDIFDGLDAALRPIRDGVGLLGDLRGGLARVATLLENPGDPEAAVGALVEQSVARLDAVDLASLQPGFQAISAAVQRIGRDALCGELCPALQGAGDRAPALFASPDLQRITALVAAFPADVIAAGPGGRARDRLLDLARRLGVATRQIVGAQAGWQSWAPRMQHYAANLQEQLLRYHRASLLGSGTAFDELTQPPATPAALREAVAAALADGLREPMTALLAFSGALGGQVAAFAQGIGGLIGVLHDRLDALVGAQGLGGVADAAEQITDLLRHLDLKPVTDPLDAVWADLDGLVHSLDPAPLRQTLTEIRDALGELLQLGTLMPQAQIDEIEQTWSALLDRVASLSPRAVISQTLDPIYAQLLAAILPVLALPGKLRELVDTTGRTLGPELLRELGRVEEAFDRMLHALPLDNSGASLTVSASASAG